METLFLNILNMSVIASYVIILVLLIRIFLKKAPKFFSYILWSVVFIRLICPFSFESIISIVPTGNNTITQEFQYRKLPDTINNNSAINEVGNTASFNSDQIESVIKQPVYSWVKIVSIIWVLGLFILFLYSLVITIRLSRSLRNKCWIVDNIYETDSIMTPFVLGIMKPKIYLPTFLNEEERAYIIRHEQTHIRRRDHIIKPIAALIVYLHWFNPLAWIAFFQMSKDMELSCDERVIIEAGTEIKKKYASSLLKLSTERWNIGGTPLAFGENSTKNRIKNILNYKKPAFIIMIPITFLLIVVIIALLTNPKDSSLHNQDIKRTSKDELFQSEEEKDIQSEHVDQISTTEDNSDVINIDNIGSVIWYLRKYQGTEQKFLHVLDRYELIREELNPETESLTVLDDNIWNIWDKWDNILITLNRFIYIAAKDNEDVNIKSPVLISVARDGSDRRIFEAPYHVVNQLTMDDTTEKIYFTGWTNDQTFPQPLYETDETLEHTKEILQLNGWMITVFDGYVYYITADKKHPGIYRVSLDEPNKPRLMDKLGFTAENYVPIINATINIEEISGNVILTYSLRKQDGDIAGKIIINH